MIHTLEKKLRRPLSKNVPGGEKGPCLIGRSGSVGEGKKKLLCMSPRPERGGAPLIVSAEIQSKKKNGRQVRRFRLPEIRRFCGGGPPDKRGKSKKGKAKGKRNFPRRGKKKKKEREQGMLATRGKGRKTTPEGGRVFMRGKGKKWERAIF